MKGTDIQNNGWVVITGASGGIGQETVRYLLERDYKVIAVCRNSEKLKHYDEYVERKSLAIISWDLNETDTLNELADYIYTNLGRISGFVHCAGRQKTKPIHMTKKKDLLDIFNINVFAAFRLIALFSAKGRFLEGNTCFVLISSTSAHEGSVGQSVYGASKGALEGYLRPAAAELMEKGIRLNIVVPGGIETDMWHEYINKLSNEQKIQVINKYPLGIGQPKDIARMIEFLLNRESAWITGQTFVADGGYLARGI